MINYSYYKISKTKKIRYIHQSKKSTPYIVFLHGFMSDLNGEKPRAFLKFAKQNNFDFHYLIDEDQTTAKNYNAVCTPDFFGFNKLLELQYRGRIDSAIMNSNEKKIKRELYFAMVSIKDNNIGPTEQNNSIGCSIKWK